MNEPLQTYTIEVTRTYTATHQGLIHVIARTEREATVMAQTMTPKRWKKISQSTKMKLSER